MSKVSALLKRGWHEVPHLVFGGGFLFFGLTLAVVSTRRHMKYNLERRQWKRRYTGTAALEGRPDPFYELRNKFLSTYKLSCCFWLPVQVANFALVPSHARVAFVGTASFLWANALCFLKKRDSKR